MFKAKTMIVRRITPEDITCMETMGQSLRREKWMYSRFFILFVNWYSHLKVYKSRLSEVAQSCPTLCNPMDSSQPGSSVHGIFQVRILEWVAISFSRGSCRPRDRTRVSCIVGRSEEVKWSEPPEKSLKLVLLGLINCSMFLFLSFYKGLFQPQLNQ